MKLTVKQIAKLTPKQRAARAKRLAYNHAYDKRKMLSKIAKKHAPMLRVSLKKAHAKLERANSIDRLETLIRELRDCRAKQVSIVEEIKSISL